MSDEHKITYVPVELWSEPQAPFEWSMKIMVLNRSDIKLPEVMAPKPDVIDGFDFHSEVDQGYYDGVCRICDGRCVFEKNLGSSWVREYRCPGCLSLAVVIEGDKMGGGFDCIRTYTQAKP